jgi:hypothetical protein
MRAFCLIRHAAPEEQAREALVRYTEETLRQHAERNENGEEDWRLVYSFPFSLLRQMACAGVSDEEQPCFRFDDRMYAKDQGYWTESRPEAGYYLVNLQGQFWGSGWEVQESLITRVCGSDYERADERVVTQALICVARMTGQRLFRQAFHLGRMVDSRGRRITVGEFSYHGLRIGNLGSKRPAPWCSTVCVARKFDF